MSTGYEGNGYATEAVSAIIHWAVQQQGVTSIEAETEFKNVASQRILEKCGFIATESIGAEGPRFVWSHCQHCS
ncbi:GNAT family N-acetyltransferase [Anaerostipes caccae]|uniref:GNAT family N-acetyltransferase n=1 Tax=Anaerostipes caccae TaxID=105841 RepID=UPI00101D2AA2|nr:GNAT family N-acetyltransferase [Anaerostipes caccae]